MHTLKLEMEAHGQESAARRLVRPLAYLFFAVMGGMAAYEELQTLAFPGITIWASHLMTIGVSSVAVVVAGYFVLQRESRLRERAVVELRERKHAWEALCESEARYRTLFERNLAGVVRTTTDGRILECNSAMANILGFDSPQKAQDRRVLDFYFSEEDRAKFLEKLKVNGRLTNFEMRLRRKDGSPAWLIANSSPVAQAAGGLQIIESTLVDITERKLAEVENTRLAVVVNSSNDAIFSTTREGVIVTWNAGAERMYGYAAEEIKGKHFSILIPEDRRADLADIEERLLQGEVLVRFEHEDMRKDGSRLQVLLTLSPIKDATGVVTGVSIISRDITERKRAEEGLIEERHLLHTLMDNLPDMIYFKDRESRFTRINKAHAKLFGLSDPAQAVGKTDFDFYSAEQAKGFHTDEQEIIRTGQPVVGKEEMETWPDGHVTWVSTTKMPLHDANGNIIGTFGVSRDITERKRTEAALRASEEHFRSLFDNMLNGYAYCKMDFERDRPVDFTYLNVNAAFESLTGLKRVVGRRVSEVIPGIRDTNPELLEIYGRVARTGTPEQFEMYLDPLEMWFSISVYSPKKGYFVAIFDVITERKRAAEALRNEKDLTESIIHSLPGTFYIIDSRGRYVRLNKNAEKVLGYSSEEFAALDPLANVAEDERSLAASKIQETFAKGKAMVEAHLLTKDGRKIPYILTATRAVIGDQVYLVGIGIDITERKQAEAEKSRLVTAIEQSAEGVVITNTAGDIEYVNPAFTRISGYSREEALGQNPRILKSGKQDPVFYQQLWATILKGEIWHGELINQRKDGKLYTEELNVAPVRDARGEITHFIATKQDVTERKRLEDQFRQAQKMEAVGRLAGGVAHDFNNLLTIINGYSEMMLDRLNSSDPTRGQLEEIRNAGDRAGTLTRQLLAFSRQQVLTPRVLDLNTLVADVEKMLRRLIGEDIDLAIVRDSALGQVKADSGQIEQILMNLAVNARDAMPVGGKLVIETANVELDEAYTERHVVVPPGRYVLLAVSDTGMGMDAETQAHIFEPFFTTKEKGKGTGLGLATVYGIVKQSSGFIWVYSEPGRGTTFKIYLPRVDEARESVRALEARGGPVPGAETILLVEDEESVRALAARILQDLGYKVLESTSPEDALQTGSRHKEPIDLLLTDVVLPRMSGRKVAEHLTFLRPGLKVLYMSGYTDDAIFRNGVLETGAAFFQKPFTPASLARKVREVLDADREEGS